MTAARVNAPTAAARFADEAAALGWEVEKLRDGDDRIVRAYRGSETYELAWTVNARGNIVYSGGDYYANQDAEGEPITNVKAALRDMTLYRAATGALLPFDPEDSTDLEILQAVAGKTVHWRTSFGTDESGFVPRGGMHLRITQSPTAENGGARILHFPDPFQTGFRSVYVGQITKVSQ